MPFWNVKPSHSQVLEATGNKVCSCRNSFLSRCLPWGRRRDFQNKKIALGLVPANHTRLSAQGRAGQQKPPFNVKTKPPQQQQAASRGGHPSRLLTRNNRRLRLWCSKSLMRKVNQFRVQVCFQCSIKKYPHFGASWSYKVSPRPTTPWLSSAIYSLLEAFIAQPAANAV